MIGSRENIYRNLIIDMYNNGIILHRKYDLLQKSYNICMYGLISGTRAFVVLAIIRLSTGPVASDRLIYYLWSMITHVIAIIIT